jgi:SAM-dependent methyltransferase
MAQTNFKHTNATGTFLLDDLMDSKISAESFDCVMSFGLLEHFKDLKPLVANLTRMVRPGGIQIHLIVPKKFSTQIINNVIWFPYNFLRLAIKKRDFKDIIRRSYRDFPHYENSFSASDYSRAFVEGGNEVIKVEPGDALTPLIRVPLGFGNILVSLFPKQLKKLMKLTHRTQSKFIYFLSPTFTVICRKKRVD